MRKKIIFLALISILITIMLIVIKNYLEYYPKQYQTIGLVSSVAASLDEELRKENSPIHEIVGRGEGIKKFDSKEYDSTIIILSKSYSLDAPEWNKKGPLLDVWGNRLVIFCSKSPEGHYKSYVVSKGKDGILKTNDDFGVGDKIN